ncbi:hypothetical protein OIU79_007675 [Salix purpurea]|uniref:phosphoribosylamine--glycine ligase n=1 Tax=Salix purpurea TaxID=77065 RepID=A0A9Q0TGK4_SALPP|nr:hypothetical protein OIU79_007675 [Salix purpurea]
MTEPRSYYTNSNPNIAAIYIFWLHCESLTGYYTNTLKCFWGFCLSSLNNLLTPSLSHPTPSTPPSSSLYKSIFPSISRVLSVTTTTFGLQTRNLVSPAARFLRNQSCRFHLVLTAILLLTRGISNSGNATCIPELDISDSSAVISFCNKWGVGLVVVGPEAPLVSGLANDLVKAGIPTFGPSAEAAALEGSKNFMKSLCDKYKIPTAKYRTFTDPSSAKQYIQDQGAPIVIKADGLAAGKGVTVAMTLEEAYEAVDSMLVKSVFGSAGCRVIVEEFLEGEEVSFFALVDGENAIPLESAQDHKRVGDGDTGPNTGGMGAYSPAPVLTKELQAVVMQTIILPTVKGMEAEGCKFVGVLYAGLMIEKKTGLPKLIEYNVRFGDPECQVLMVRMESDLAQVLLAASRGELSGVSLKWSPGSAMVVVMASKGYPGSYEKGTEIRNLEEAENVAPTVKIFHAGTALNSDGNFIATGGRVLGVTATGRDLEEARDRAYQAVEEINWPGGFYRRDIGWRALPQKELAPKK